MSIFKTPYIVEKNIEIDASIDTVWENITVHSKKFEWSPWYRQEPDCKIIKNGDTITEGFKEEREGIIIGSGAQTITKVEKNKYYEGQLEFYKPMKGKAINKMYLKEVGGKIHVKWIMESSLPIFLFFLKPMIKSMVSMDFERGLYMLKALSEKGEIHSKSESIGRQKFKGGYYIGIRKNLPADEMPIEMEKDFKNLIKYFYDNNIPITQNTYTIYNKSDLIRGVFDYTSCIPINHETFSSANLEGTEFIKGESKSFESHAIRHTGSYNFLGNAWNYAYAYPKGYRINVSYKKAPVEVYVTNPNETPDNENITDIYVPLK